jgi:hypothetical protein
MGDLPALGGGQFGRANIESAINLDRIAIDNFAAELLGNIEGQLAFAGRSGAENDKERFHAGGGGLQRFVFFTPEQEISGNDGAICNIV